MTQIFISYARDDDEPPPDEPGVKGFVEWLYAQIQWRLRQLPEPRPTLWRDVRQISPAEQFPDELAGAVAASGILVVVLSPNWLQREWCKRELATFAERHAAEDEGQLRRRIVCVVKSHVPVEQRPPLLQGQVGYQFFEIAKDNGEETEFFRGRPVHERCLPLADDLARDLWELASNQPAPPRPEPQPVEENGRTVFVAWPAADMETPYRTVVEELHRRGYRVTPEPVSPAERPTKLLDAGAARAFLDEALGQAELSVHLLGEGQGFAPEDAPPLVPLQLQRAAERLPGAAAAAPPEAHAFHRLIWAPKSLPGKLDAPERDPFAVLQRFDPQALRAGDKTDGDVLPKFVQFVSQHLEAVAPTREARPVGGNGARVYIRFQTNDLDFGLTMAERLSHQGLQPILPGLDEDPGSDALHRRYLKECDAVLFCWEQASDVWLKANIAELRSWRDLGRTGPFGCRSVALGPPSRPSKLAFKRIPTDVDLVIDPPEALGQLVERLGGAAA